MKILKCFFVYVLIGVPSAHALTLRPELNYHFFNNYSVALVENKFESQGLGLGLSFFFDRDEFSEFIDDGALSGFTGFGFQYVGLKTASLNGTPLTFPENLESSLFKFQFLLGASYWGWRLEIPISALYLIEQMTPLEDDEKYGWGIGVLLYYSLTENFLLGLGFERLSFAHGKNASTGAQGTLANDIVLSGPKVTMGYNFHWGAR